MPHALLRMAGDALGGWYRRALRRFVYGPATLKVDWALDGPIPWLNHEVARAGTVHVAGSEQELLSAIAQSARGCPRGHFCCSASRASPTPAERPDGQHTAWAYTHGPQDADWPALTERHVDAMEAQIERFAPGFRDRILARHVLGPR